MSLLIPHSGYISKSLPKLLRDKKSRLIFKAHLMAGEISQGGGSFSKKEKTEEDFYFKRKVSVFMLLPLGKRRVISA